MPTSRIRLQSHDELRDISIKTAYEGTTHKMHKITWKNS